MDSVIEIGRMPESDARKFLEALNVFEFDASISTYTGGMARIYIPVTADIFRAQQLLYMFIYGKQYGRNEPVSIDNIFV